VRKKLAQIDILEILVAAFGLPTGYLKAAYRQYKFDFVGYVSIRGGYIMAKIWWMGSGRWALVRLDRARNGGY
jgi:hypothetical protein